MHQLSLISSICLLYENYQHFTAMKVLIVVVVAAVAVVSGDVSYLPPTRDTGAGYPSGGRPTYGAPQADESSGPAQYEFSYEVKDPQSGNDFGHKENRNGDIVNGAYYVVLPDGRTQFVDYVADQGGYRPQVRYEGEAKYGPPAGRPAADTGAGGYRY